MLKKDMRLKAAIVLLSIFFAVFSPVSIGITVSDSGKTNVITTLDICHANNSMLSVNSDMSAIHESPYTLCEPYLAIPYKIQNPRFNDLLITFQEEHPPRV